MIHKKNDSNRTIEYVLNIETGETIDSEKFFSQDENTIWNYRRVLKDAIDNRRSPLFVCYFCNQLVRIRGGVHANSTNPLILHFAHLVDSDECPIKTNSKLSKKDWEKVMYNGAKESVLHIETKELIGKFLNYNSNNIGDISNIEIEQIKKDNRNYTLWRKPDVSCFFKNERLVFEIQLSSTFLNVIADREHFYKENQIYILWVFKNFDTETDKQKFTQKDIFYSNNRNAFLLNREAIVRSEYEKDLVLYCQYQKPEVINGEIVFRWVSQFVTLKELTFESNSYKVYYYDVSGEERKLRSQLSKENEQNKIIKFEKERNKALLELQLEKRKKEIESNFLERVNYNYGDLTELRKLFIYPSFFRDSVTQLFVKYNYQPTDTDKTFLNTEFKIALKEDYPGHYWVLHHLAIAIFFFKILKSNKPYYLKGLMQIERILCAILSFKFKRVIGYNYKDLLQLAHHVLLRNEYADMFLKGIEKYYGLNNLYKEDKTGKFERKVIDCRTNKPEQNKKNDEMFKIIFPELSQE